MRKSPIAGHVLIDMDASGVKLLAQANAQPPYRTEDHLRFLASITERATKPLDIKPLMPPSHFAFHA